MGAIVAFDWSKWAARFPELSASMRPEQVQAYFDEATLYQANDGSGPIHDDVQQLALLNLLTAHIAKRYAIINGQMAPDVVGRVSNASEGSVSIALDMGTTPAGTPAWAQQTRYGADWWNATKQFRTFRYRPGFLSTRGL